MELVAAFEGSGQPHIVVTDRYYTSVKTAHDLREKNIYMVGTLRTDRGAPADLVADVKNFPLELGEWRWMTSPTEEMSVVVWRDSDPKGTWFLSTVHDPEEVTEVRRRIVGQQSVMRPAPMVAKAYNEDMGFVDSSNHMKRNYSIQLEHRQRWYMCLIYYILELSIMNSLILFRKTLGDISHAKFRERLILELAGQAIGISALSPPARRTRFNEEKDLDRLNHGGHMPTYADKKRNCVFCWAHDKKESKSTFKCKDCDVYLHIAKDKCGRECFRLFYEQETLSK